MHRRLALAVERVGDAHPRCDVVQILRIILGPAFEQRVVAVGSGDELDVIARARSRSACCPSSSGARMQRHSSHACNAHRIRQAPESAGAPDS